MFRRDDRWREFWNGIDDHEEQAQPEPQRQWHEDDDDEFIVGMGYYGF